MQIQASRPYHGRIVKTGLLRLADGRSAFKLYYVSVLGRDEPARYEWAQAPTSFAALEGRLRGLGLEGVGFVTAFPHITKVFRFAPSAEIVLHVKAYDTTRMSPIDLKREDGFVEFACYAEAALAADEYRFWADAATVAEYLAGFSSFADAPIAEHAKLGAYWHGSA
ncbi:MAG: hypothetical protein JXR37_17130 [Kiritimatiellae bacterium]|nr:hypothetical protein [Kiritimatiellia bacterium]